MIKCIGIAGLCQVQIQLSKDVLQRKMGIKRSDEQNNTITWTTKTTRLRRYSKHVDESDTSLHFLATLAAPPLDAEVVSLSNFRFLVVVEGRLFDVAVRGR